MTETTHTTEHDLSASTPCEPLVPRHDAITDMLAEPAQPGLATDLNMMAGAIIHDDGTAHFCDAVGAVLRKPVADWIRFMAQRLSFQARQEMARQLNDPTLTDDTRNGLALDLRRTLRIDALNILTGRADAAFEAARAAENDLPDVPVRRNAFAGIVSPDLIRAVEAHREACQLMLHDPDESDERTAAGVARVTMLGDAIRNFEARTPADLRHKIIYLWSGILSEVGDTEARDNLISIERDVQRLAGPAAVASPDPIFALIDEAWRLVREHARLHAISGSQPDDHPAWDPENEAHDAMWQHVRGVMLKTVPTTAEGCRALAQFTIDFNKDQGVPVEYDSNDPVFDLIARSPLAQSVATRTADASSSLALARYVHDYFGEKPDPVMNGDLELWTLAERVISEAGADPDAELLQLGQRYDEAHAAWRRAEVVEREPRSRHDAVLHDAKVRGGPTIDDHVAAEAVPGFKEAREAEEAAFDEAASLASQILERQPRSIQGIATQARAVISHVWAGCSYEDDAAVGRDEDIDKSAIRALIESCCSAAGLDWRGDPVTASRVLSKSASADAEGEIPDPHTIASNVGLERLSMPDLMAVHGVAELFIEVGQAALCQPRCGIENDGVIVGRSPAGAFAEWLTEVARGVHERARQQAQQHRPLDEGEGEKRLAIIAYATVSNGDASEMRAMARDLDAQAHRIEVRRAARG